MHRITFHRADWARETCGRPDEAAFVVDDLCTTAKAEADRIHCEHHHLRRKSVVMTEMERGPGARPVHARLFGWALGLLLAVELLSLVPTWINAAPAGDEALFGYVGYFWGQGDFLPYRDAFENKPPAIFWVFRKLIGEGRHLFSGPRIAAAIGLLVCSVFAGLLAAEVCGSGPGALLGMLCACLLLRRGIDGPLADTEAFMLPFVCLAMLVVYRAVTSGRTLPLVAAGVLFGIAFLFKPVAAAELAAAALVLLLLRRPRGAAAFDRGELDPDRTELPVGCQQRHPG